MREHSDYRSNSRRSFLKAAGAVVTGGALAGCTGGNGDGNGDDSTPTDGDGGATATSTTSSLETFTNEAGIEVGATFEAVEELAKDEDGITVYATIDRDEWADWVGEFNEQYPDIDINHVTGGSEDLISRWDSEYKSDNVNASLFISGSKAPLIWGRGQNLKLKPEYIPNFGEAPDKFKDTENNNWIAMRQIIGSIHYNTDQVEPDAASGWMDLVTDGRWSGQKIGWDPTPSMAHMRWFWDTFGEEFFTSLREQQPRWVDSHTDLARLCGAGEFPVSFTYTHKMADFGNELPLDYFKGDGFDKMPSQAAPGVVNNKAPAPNAALLFFNYLLSEEGQKGIGRSGYIPWHPNAAFQGYEGVYPSDEYEVEVVVPNSEKNEKMRKRWQELMGDAI